MDVLGAIRSQPSGAHTVAVPSLPELIAGSALHAVAIATDTRYQHKSEIDPSRGRFYTDCSGFVSWLLQQTAPAHLEAVRRASGAPGGSRLRAWQYHDAFDAAPPLGRAPATEPFGQITRAAQLAPGDFIATKNPRTESNSGHLMIVIGPPVPVIRAGRIVAFAVRVADSTATPHEADSRSGGKTGLGTGVIALGVDARGEIISYYRHGYDPRGPSLVDHDCEGGRFVDRIAVARARPVALVTPSATRR